MQPRDSIKIADICATSSQRAVEPGSEVALLPCRPAHPAFAACSTAGDKSWPWRPGNKARSEVGATCMSVHVCG